MASITRAHLITANQQLEVKVTALEARIVVATDVFKSQRARIAELEALLATRGCIATAPAPTKAAPTHKVTRFAKADGSIWERHQWAGNSRSVIRPAVSA